VSVPRIVGIVDIVMVAVIVKIEEIERRTCRLFLLFRRFEENYEDQDHRIYSGIPLAGPAATTMLTANVRKVTRAVVLLGTESLVTAYLAAQNTYCAAPPAPTSRRYLIVDTAK